MIKLFFCPLMQNRVLTFEWRWAVLKLKIEIKDADNMDVNQQHSYKRILYTRTIQQYILNVKYNQTVTA
jgi:hypothetical protein